MSHIFDCERCHESLSLHLYAAVMLSRNEMQVFRVYAEEVIYRSNVILEFHDLWKAYLGIGQLPGAPTCDPFILIKKKHMERYFAETILAHVAGLSMLFFPSEKGAPQRRGKRLREMFEVRGDSPLNNRKLRNSMTHTDERLDFIFKGWEKVENGTLKHFDMPRSSTFGIDMEGFTVIWFDASLTSEEGRALITEAQRLKEKVTMHIPAWKMRSF